VLLIIEAHMLQGKAVVVTTGSIRRGTYQSYLGIYNYKAKIEDIYRRNIAKLESLGVLFVTAAGNTGPACLTNEPVSGTGDWFPQSFGTADNNVITVGGTYRSGAYHPMTSPKGSESNSETGSITVYAQAADVDTLGLGGVPGRAIGTSFSAPQVGGLIVYFLGLPENAARFQWTGDGPGLCRAVKQYLVAKSYRRIRMEDQNLPSLFGRPPYIVPTDINVAYNNAWGPQTRELPITYSLHLRN
jgi:hypothetical protein